MSSPVEVDSNEGPNRYFFVKVHYVFLKKFFKNNLQHEYSFIDVVTAIETRVRLIFLFLYLTLCVYNYKYSSKSLVQNYYHARRAPGLVRTMIHNTRPFVTETYL